MVQRQLLKRNLLLPVGDIGGVVGDTSRARGQMPSPLGCWIAVGSVFVGLLWQVGAGLLAAPDLNSCAEHLVSVVVRPSLEFVLLSIVFYSLAAWVLIQVIRRVWRRYGTLKARAFWIAGIFVAVVLLTWGQLALHALVRFHPDMDLLPRGIDPIACTGEQPSLWPDWLPLPKAVDGTWESL
ncbi:hypothetical protein [Saccharomonospora cyanea]|uniref:hypothetical protein n=1 Tax=Saccharomonospora cyanea TaxID=40989 RepID=UPI0012FCE041|nr:hypothetical protein [Saccharomonospora cyanea]